MIFWYKFFLKKNYDKAVHFAGGRGGVKGKVNRGSLFYTFFLEPFPYPQLHNTDTIGVS